MTRERLSLVIPVFDEAESLHPLHEKLLAMLNSLNLDWEIIYVDDGSRDSSTKILRELAESDSRVIAAIQRRNFGKSIALMTGFALATGDYIATLDSDLQDEPNEVPRLLECLREGNDIVIGWKQKRNDPLSKRIPSKIANGMTRFATGLDIHDMNSGLKLYRQECAKRLRIYGDLHRYIPIIAHLDGFRVAEMPVVHHPRQFGKSKYGLGRLLRGGFDFLTVLFLSRYGRRPMHLFGLIGLISFSLGVLINLELTRQWFNGVRPIGDRPLLLLGILLILVGIQFLTMGLVAEMIVTVHQDSNDPLATMRSLYRKEEK